MALSIVASSFSIAGRGSVEFYAIKCNAWPPLRRFVDYPNSFAYCPLSAILRPSSILVAMLVNTIAAFAALLPAVVLGQGSLPTIAGNGSTVMADGKYQIVSEGIRANFIPYGASISNLFINDTRGVERDIVLGFDNASYYSVDKLHPHLGGIPG